MKKILASVVMILFAMSTMSFAQNPPSVSGGGKYGVAAWAILNQRVASQYNYDLDATIQNGFGTYNYPAQQVQTLICKNAGACLNPFNTNASVNVIDIQSANSEVVVFNGPNGGTVNGNVINISLATSNTHSSFHLRSGTCGLQEAINDLGTSGGEIIVDQKFYDDGCTAATITGTTAGLALVKRGNIFIHDISAGQDTWYGLKPTALTLISAAGAALVPTFAAGSSTFYVNYEYVDAIGGQGLANTESAQLTSATYPIAVPSPAAATGAVGWIPTITAASGSSGAETVVPVTSTVCTLSTTTVIPSCAIGSAATIAAAPGSTAIQNVESWGHTTFAYQPLAGPPSLVASSTAGMFQTSFGPFVVGSTLNSGSTANEDLAQFYVPPGYFNYLGKTWDICLKGQNATMVASSVFVLKLNAATQYGQSAVTLGTVTYPTQTAAATVSVFNGCFTIQTAATGSSGTFWVSAASPFTLQLTSGAYVLSSEVTVAASSGLDLTKGLYFSINASDTAADNITGPIINNLTIKARM